MEDDRMPTGRLVDITATEENTNSTIPQPDHDQDAASPLPAHGQNAAAGEQPATETQPFPVTQAEAHHHDAFFFAGGRRRREFRLLRLVHECAAQLAAMEAQNACMDAQVARYRAMVESVGRR